MTDIEEIVALSHYYGANPDYVIAGGGNTSCKDETVLAVKGSGVSLNGITADGFVRMDRRALGAIWEKQYPQEPAAREQAALSDLMAARLPGEEEKRPSVETLLHDLFPWRFVVHTHPALVNGITCSQQGEDAARKIFAGRALWAPLTNPGYVLAALVKKLLEDYAKRNGRAAEIVLLQNHGVFAGADTADGIRRIYADLMEKTGAAIKRQPDFSGGIRDVSAAEPAAGDVRRVLEQLAGGSVLFLRDRETAALVKDRASFAPVSSAFTPDHIVYAGSDPLFIESGAEQAIRGAWDAHVLKTGRPPKIAAVQGLGVFGLGVSEKAASLALELFRDAVKIAVYAESFGGPRFMTAEHIAFINNWEVERYRSQVSLGK